MVLFVTKYKEGFFCIAIEKYKTAIVILICCILANIYALQQYARKNIFPAGSRLGTAEVSAQKSF